ncbi:hypothetical protein KL86DYS2_10207 [uncultured Dysgonomonas sp.]|uniref:Uncharacterized protein n=1 Tax=uncultured Dysgonomonas sp. TaxID=206096 RepID=A0A212IWL0_9BACT|nr:hypothetical protein KL86DYS2_10207 [uncultured Dysgonomonas sp.]
MQHFVSFVNELKGNQVKILNRPAAVSSVKLVQHSHCYSKWEGCTSWSKSEDLQSNSSDSFRGIELKKQCQDYIVFSLFLSKAFY